MNLKKGKDNFHDNHALTQRVPTFLAFLFFTVLLICCTEEKVKVYSSEIYPFEFYSDTSPIETINDLKRGDILVKPNINWLNGTSSAPGGDYFGHAAIVLNDVSDTNQLRLLKNAEIFESVARELPPPYQVRKSRAIIDTLDPFLSNTSFIYKGARYRLRSKLSETKIDSIIDYILSQDEATHSWRAMKEMDPNPNRKREKWYCSQLIWQAFYDVASIDLDCNGGFVVYPNDLINHPMFDGYFNEEKCRVRF